MFNDLLLLPRTPMQDMVRRSMARELRELALLTAHDWRKNGQRMRALLEKMLDQLDALEVTNSLARPAATQRSAS